MRTRINKWLKRVKNECENKNKQMVKVCKRRSKIFPTRPGRRTFAARETHRGNESFRCSCSQFALGRVLFVSSIGPGAAQLHATVRLLLVLWGPVILWVAFWKQSSIDYIFSRSKNFINERQNILLLQRSVIWKLMLYCGTSRCCLVFFSFLSTVTNNFNTRVRLCVWIWIAKHWTWLVM